MVVASEVIGYNWTRRYDSLIQMQMDMNGLVYNGPGWYHSGEGQTALVVTENSQLLVFVWDVDPREKLRELIALPNRDGGGDEFYHK